MRTLPLLLLLFVVTGCATAEHRARYQLARDFIVTEHNKAIFGPETAWVTPQDLQLDGITPGTLSQIQEKYFAVTKDRIGSECIEHYLACKDPLTFEYVVRNVHNSEIVASRETKLKTLESWSDGKTSDAELLKAIGWTMWPATPSTEPGRSPAFAQRP